MTDLFRPTIDELIAEARREVEMRRQVFGRQLSEGKMSREQHDRRIAMMEEIVKILENVKLGGTFDVLKGKPDA